jgi:hypothetical protein
LYPGPVLRFQGPRAKLRIRALKIHFHNQNYSV